MPSIIFMGTPEFAVASLRAVHERFAVRAVVTVPDKPKGRGLQMQPPPVKQAAEELGITTILQPESLKTPEFHAELAALRPDVIAVVAFRILPANIYTLARLGAYNVHGSLLPKFRGAAPINWTIIEGERETGVTSFLLADSVDTGAMLGRRTLPIPDGMTAGELHDAMMPLAAELAVETCEQLLSGTATPLPQDDTHATKAPKIFREMCHIDWTQPAERVRSFIHGLSPHPGAWTTLPDGKTLKILRASIHADIHAEHEGVSGLQAGELQAGEFAVWDGVWRVSCGDGVLSLTELQPESKRAMPISEYLRGYRGAERGRFV
jgi:methionyl-tRNA formyltransferase